MSVLIKHMAMPEGCIYANDKDQTDYCPMLNHDDVPFCQYIENEPESAIGIDERPVYCPLSDVPDTNVGDIISRQAAIETVMECYDNDELFEVYEDKLRELPPANCSEFPNSSDTISRQQATDTLRGYLVGKRCPNDGTLTCRLIENEVISKLPSAQPDIIRCRNCKFASGDSRICMKFGHSPIGELDFCAWAERKTDE